MLLTDPPRLCSGLYGDDYKTQTNFFKGPAQTLKNICGPNGAEFFFLQDLVHMFQLRLASIMRCSS